MQTQLLDPYMLGIYILVLSIVIGVEIISKVPPTLHTPLMSGTNAISGITIIGALYCVGFSDSSFTVWVGCLAIVLAMTNVVGGFLVTDRMLKMFHKKKSKLKD